LRKRFDYILLPTIAGYTGHTRYLPYPRILQVELQRQLGLPLVYELVAFETELEKFTCAMMMLP